MFGARELRKQPSSYATRGDFCRIFAKDMNRLYLLSFLLTADEAVAEQCFVGGFHTVQEGNFLWGSRRPSQNLPGKREKRRSGQINSGLDSRI